MKIVSWNINGIRAILGQNPKRKYDKIENDNKLFKYIDIEKPDILCLQETKAEESQINEDLRYPPGYVGYYNHCKIKKGYSGVVTFSKKEPLDVKYGFGIEKFDNEGRFIETDFGDFTLMNVYFPNGTSGRDRIDYKLEFYDALFAYSEKLRKKGKSIIICGDYNTAHNEIDLARPKENEKNSGFLPEERVKIDEILSMGYIDSFRKFESKGEKYTWWSNRGGSRERNIGWRIDYHMVSDNLMPHVTNSYHREDIWGSDHCPIIIELNL